MEHSSYELSIQLRDAGFPQPELAPGQTWYLDIYDKEWEAAFVCMVEDSLVDVFWIGKREGLLGRDRFLGAVYCPTVEDMLSMLRYEISVSCSAEYGYVLKQVWDGKIIHSATSILELLSEAFIGNREVFADTGSWIAE